MKRVKSIAFLLIGCVLFVALQRILTPKWNYPLFCDNPRWSVQGFLNQEKDIDEVIFLGTSHSLCSISPIHLYENNGIVSYNLSSSNQPLGMTYEVLKAALKTQKPKVVVVDCSRILNYQNFNEAWGYILDSIPMCYSKLEMAKTYADEMITNNEKTDWNKYFFSTQFPVVQYHTRWKEIDKNDFGAESGFCYTNGYFMDTRINPSGWTKDTIDEIAYSCLEDTSQRTTSYMYGVNYSNEIRNNLYQPEISEDADYWVEKIVSECEKNDVELLFVKIPTNDLINNYDGAWTEIKSNIMKQYTFEKNLNYLDLQYDVELGLDWKVDTSDSGWHLNYNGAHKVSNYLGDYLVNHYDVGAKSVPEMDEKLIKYNKLGQIAELQSDPNVISYLDKLKQNAEKYVICMAVNDGYMFGLPEDVSHSLNNLGLKTEFSNYNYQHSYLAYIDGGEAVYEAMSNRPIEWEATEAKTGFGNIYMRSSGWYTGSQAKIVINGIDYAINSRGLNVVVIDKETGLVVDKMVADAYVDAYSCAHKSVIDLIEQYAIAIN